MHFVIFNKKLITTFATTGVQFENSDEIGVFALLTNKYALAAYTPSANFYSAFQQELMGHIPVVSASIAGTRIIGSMAVGNKNGS